MMKSKQIRVYSDTHDRLSSLKAQDEHLTFDQIIEQLLDIAGIPGGQRAYEKVAMPVWQDK
jgi:hypothetical protein